MSQIRCCILHGKVRHKFACSCALYTAARSQVLQACNSFRADAAGRSIQVMSWWLHMSWCGAALHITARSRGFSHECLCSGGSSVISTSVAVQCSAFQASSIHDKPVGKMQVNNNARFLSDHCARALSTHVWRSPSSTLKISPVGPKQHEKYKTQWSASLRHTSTTTQATTHTSTMTQVSMSCAQGKTETQTIRIRMCMWGH